MGLGATLASLALVHVVEDHLTRCCATALCAVLKEHHAEG